MLLLENIPHLLSGVTQKSKTQRHPTQAQAQVNAYSDPQDGLRKRPPTEWIATLDAAATYDSNTFVHVINRSTADRYLVIVENGVLSVYNAETGAELTVIGADTDNYLNIQPTPGGDSITLNGTSTSLLTAFAPPAGGAFVAVSTNALATFDTDNHLTFPSAINHLISQYVWNVVIPQADYTVTGVWLWPGIYDPADTFSLRARNSLTTREGYQIQFGASTWNLVECNAAGVHTSLATDTYANVGASVPVKDVEYTGTLTVSGTTISATFGGVTLASVTDATLAGPGYMGLGGATGAGFGSDLHVVSIASTYDIPAVGSSTPTLRAATIGDTTVLVNTSKTVLLDTTKAAARLYEALVFVRQADFGTSYSITLNGNSVTVSGKVGSTAAARDDIATDQIALELVARLEGNVAINTSFTFTRYGSTIYITRADGEDFTISTNDGLADNAILALKGSVQRFDDLPAIGVNGFIIEVTGDPGSEFDNYWVVYDDLDMPDEAGVWRETVKPGILTELDAATMPHKLVLNGGVVNDFESIGETKLPTISDTGGGSDSYEGFETTQWTAPRGTNGADAVTIREQGSVLYSTPQDANGLETKFYFYFDVDTRRVRSGNDITLTFATSTAAAPTVYGVDQMVLSYSPGQYLMGQADRAFTYALEAGARIRVTLTYESITPEDYSIPNRLARVTFTGRNKLTVGQDHLGVTYEPKTGKALTFGPTTEYPDTLVITMTIAGTDYAIDCSNGPDGTALAAYVAANQVIAGYTLSNPSAGVLNIVKGAGTAYTFTVAQTWDATTHANVAGLGATDHSTLILFNVTDGSTAIITSNTDNSILTAALAGGATNTYNPGDLLRILATTSDYFSLLPIPWTARAVGDDDTNPFPTLVNDKINGVFFYKNRLGFLSGANVAMSAAGDLYNFTRITAKQLLDDDFIDVIATSRKTADLHSAVMWNKALYLLSDNAQFSLSGQPILTPKTVAIELVKDYENHPLTPPVTSGNSLFFANMRQDSGVQIMDFRSNADATDGIAASLTDDVQTYIDGEPYSIITNADLGFIGVLTRTDVDTMYVCIHRENAESRQMLSWSKWEFPGAQILGAAFVESRLYFVMERDGFIMLERMSLDERATTVDHIDCRMSLLSVGDGGGPEKFVFAYPQFSSTPTVVAVAADKTYATAAVEGAGYYVAADVAALTKNLGLEYTFSYTFSPLYHQNREQKPETRGRLQLRYLKLEYSVARALNAAVTLLGRSTINTVLNLAAIAAGTMSIPIMGQTEQATIVLTDASPYPVTLTSADWEGYWHIRNPNRR